ncbi:MAG: acyltransferase family protein [Prevotellaceae bacterium]|nr:acyltransferase family protein [Prevotellaceae bacterium]
MTKTGKVKERIVSLDIAKAICIVLVVIGHYMPESAPDWYLTLHSVIYTFHMPLFMFASGYIYLATRKDEGYGAFLLRKVRRLLIPYFSTSVMVISFKLLSQGHAYVENPVTALSYLKMFYQPEAGYFLWFVWALWWMFVIAPLFKTARSRLALLLVAIFMHLVPLRLPDVLCMNEFKRMLVYFMFGVVACEHRALQTIVMGFSKAKTVCVSLLFVGAETLHGEKMLTGGGNLLLNFLLPFLGVLFVMEVSKLMEKVAKRRGGSVNLLMLISASSYIIYLFHTTFEGMAKALCHKVLVGEGVWLVFVAEAAFVVFVGVAVPVLLYRFALRKFAVTRWLFGL